MSAESPAPPPMVHRVPRRHGAPAFAAYAGFVSRMVAMIVDLLILATIWVLGGIAVTFIGETSGISQIVGLLKSLFNWVTPLQEFLLSASFSALTLLTLSLSYFTFFYVFGGATLGKYLMGLRVVRTDGRPIHFGQAALRTIAYAASSLPVYLGFLNVLVDDRRRAWHDILTRTAVVYTWNARPDETFLRDAIDWLNRERR